MNRLKMGAGLNVQIGKASIRYKQGTLRNKSRIKYNYDGYELFCIMLKSIMQKSNLFMLAGVRLLF